MGLDSGRLREDPVPTDFKQWDDVLDQLEARCSDAYLADLDSQAGLGHELRQPLFTISMASENLRLMLESPQISKRQMIGAIDRITEQVGRAQTIIANVIARATGARRLGTTDPGRALDNAIRFLEPLFDMTGIALKRCPFADTASVALDQVQMEQVFVNVLRNAVDSISARRRQGWDECGGIVARFASDDRGLRCVISDNGAGLAKGVSQTQFRPFVTTKASEGTGLGLYICERILLHIGGSIVLRPGQTEGAEVDIHLPLAPPTT